VRESQVLLFGSCVLLSCCIRIERTDSCWSQQVRLFIHALLNEFGDVRADSDESHNKHKLTSGPRHAHTGAKRGCPYWLGFGLADGFAGPVSAGVFPPAMDLSVFLGPGLPAPIASLGSTVILSISLAAKSLNPCTASCDNKNYSNDEHVIW